MKIPSKISSDAGKSEVRDAVIQILNFLHDHFVERESLPSEYLIHEKYPEWAINTHGFSVLTKTLSSDERKRLADNYPVEYGILVTKEHGSTTSDS